MEHVDYLVIGHVAKDLKNGSFVLGGSAVYAAVTALRLGRRVGMVTACEPGIDLKKALPGVLVSRAPSLISTVFKNIYRDGQREQHLYGRAADLQAKHVPAPWRTSRLVHLAPIAQELPPEIADTFAGSFIGLTVQGWLRGWDAAGKVYFKPWPEAAAVLPKLSAVVLSKEDVEGREDIVDYFAERAPVVAVTQGKRGAKVYWQGGWHHFPAFPTKEVDPTGAGDVFAAAFFHRLEQAGDPLAAAVFANCAASFSVEAPGMAGIPSQSMIERRLRGAE